MKALKNEVDSRKDGVTLANLYSNVKKHLKKSLEFYGSQNRNLLIDYISEWSAILPERINKNRTIIELIGRRIEDNYFDLRKNGLISSSIDSNIIEIFNSPDPDSILRLISKENEYDLVKKRLSSRGNFWDSYFIDFIADSQVMPETKSEKMNRYIAEKFKEED